MSLARSISRRSMPSMFKAEEMPDFIPHKPPRSCFFA
jgi:hypothetical protein